MRGRVEISKRRLATAPLWRAGRALAEIPSAFSNWKNILSAVLPRGGNGSRKGCNGKPKFNPNSHPVMKTLSKIPAKFLPFQLSDSRVGRILLHLTCIARHGRFQWHFQGILREFAFTTACR